MPDIVVVEQVTNLTVTVDETPDVQVTVTEGRGPTGPSAPSPNGFLAENIDICRCTRNGTAGTAGTQLKFGKVFFTGGVTLTTLHAFCITGSSATLANTYMSLHDLSGNLLRSSASLTTVASNSLATFTLTSTYTPSTDGFLLVALQVGSNGGGTTPTWIKTPILANVAVPNANLMSPNFRVAQATGSNGPMPATLSGVNGTNEDSLFWFGAK